MVAVPYQFLDLTPGAGNLLGESYWEMLSPYVGASLRLNTGASPKDAIVCSLSQILEDSPPSRYYLSRTACLGILRRASERGKELPPQLKTALMIQAGLIPLQRISDDPIAFAANQRDEVRDLHDIAGALGAQPGMKQQTFVTQESLTPWDTQQKRFFTPQSKAPTLAGADGCGGKNPAGLLFAAAFSAGAGASAGSIGYTQEGSPTLKGSDGGNMVPAILCLNDQGGSRMEMQEELSSTLRAQEHGHQPLVLFENHGVDSRYTGPHPVAPTMSARYGTGGNNVPLVGQEEPEAYSITGKAANHNAIFNRRRVDVFKDEDIASTESARQHKDATDLILQEKENKTSVKLIRRLTPLERERLQGFPDGWTDIPGASDSARYKSLGNSVAIPCVEYVMAGIAAALG